MALDEIFRSIPDIFNRPIEIFPMSKFSCWSRDKVED